MIKLLCAHFHSPIRLLLTRKPEKNLPEVSFRTCLKSLVWSSSLICPSQHSLSPFHAFSPLFSVPWPVAGLNQIQIQIHNGLRCHWCVQVTVH